jgi:hypothetical protein
LPICDSTCRAGRRFSLRTESDILFGPYVQRPGGGKIRPTCNATLDDASRLIPHAQFYTGQGLDACLDCLRQSIAARGLPVRLYMDNAKIYRGPLQTFVIDRVVSQEIREPRDEEGCRELSCESIRQRDLLGTESAGAKRTLMRGVDGFVLTDALARAVAPHEGAYRPNVPAPRNDLSCHFLNQVIAKDFLHQSECEAPFCGRSNRLEKGNESGGARYQTQGLAASPIAEKHGRSPCEPDLLAS